MEKVRVGFLPLYLKLYDDRAARVRPAIEEYRDDLVAALENQCEDDSCEKDEETRDADRRGSRYDDHDAAGCEH